MKTKHIILFVFMFVCGCAVTFFLNNNRRETPMEFLHEKTLEPPKVEILETSYTTNDNNDNIRYKHPYVGESCPYTGRK